MDLQYGYITYEATDIVNAYPMVTLFLTQCEPTALFLLFLNISFRKFILLRN